MSTGDYPRGYTVTTSTDGVNWSTAVASAAGTGQFTTVPLTGAPVRYVRITLTAASGSWFSVADVRAYTAGARATDPRAPDPRRPASADPRLPNARNAPLPPFPAPRSNRNDVIVAVITA